MFGEFFSTTPQKYYIRAELTVGFTFQNRYRRCTGDLEVCCRPRNTTTTTMKPTTTTTTTMKTTTTTKATTTTSTLPPVIFPTTEPQPIPICICVSATQCDPNGIIGNSGEGVINPRAQYIQCPSNMVCCRPTSVIQYPVVTNPPVVVSPQICVLCGNAIQCNNGVVIPVNVGIINPVVTYGQQTCPIPTSCCQAINTGYGNGIPVVIGPVRNPGTTQACYCMKSWLCIPGNTVSTNGAGAIDPRLSLCGSADEVCCRASPTINVARNDDLDKSDGSIVNGEVSFLQPGCGVQNKTYATGK